MKPTKRQLFFAITGGLLSCVTAGCASGPGGIFSEQALQERRLSAAQTPLAQAKAAEAQKRQAMPVAKEQGLPGGIAQRPFAQLDSAQLDSAQLDSAQLGSSRPSSAQTKDLNSIALAAYNGGGPATSAAPAIASQPGNHRQSNRESYAVPREALPVAPQIVDPTAPAVGSPYRQASHARVLGGGTLGNRIPQAHADGCACCSRGKSYRPLFPQMTGTCEPASAGDSGVSCNVPCEVECAPAQRCADPQEYIFDGGDRDPQVRLREDLTQTGLDPEDTVIQYTTKTGVTEVQSGCRVAIYAPRFGSVRKRTGILTTDLALRPQAAILPNGPGMLKEQLPPVNVMVPLKPNTKDAVRVVEAFRDRQRPMPSDLVLPMGVLSDAFKPYEDLDIIRNGDLRGTDPAKLALAAAAARVWTNLEQLQVIIDGQEAVAITDLKQAREFTLYEYKGARIRLCKVASEQIANPGDIISFTIRYDNVGEQPVNKLVVTDSLAPRLEYVDATQQSSLEASFTTTPNEAGSSVLRWEINKELKPGEGGFVRFDAKVR